MRFIRRSKAESDQPLCCPRCKEILPEGTLDCDMCGYKAVSAAQAQCDPVESVVERGAVSPSEVPARQ